MFKVGDRVRLSWSCMSNDGKEGVISEDDGSVIPYKVTLDDGEVEWKHQDHITKLEETSMKFKVGDTVKILNNDFDNRGKVGIIKEISGTIMIYCVEFTSKCGSGIQWSNESDLELVTEEEISMKFKVGDKVKVKDSWFGFTGKVGVVIECDAYDRFPYRVKFDVQDGEDKEVFVEESLEAEKQQFTKSDLKTGMGVVLRDGSKGHVLLGTEAGDVIRFINEDSQQWGSVDEYGENMIDCDMPIMDIVEVYSSKYAYCYLTDRVFNQDCLFKREEPKPEPIKMTMKEINEHFGKVIEIVE